MSVISPHLLIITVSEYLSVLGQCWWPGFSCVGSQQFVYKGFVVSMAMKAGLVGSLQLSLLWPGLKCTICH